MLRRLSIFVVTAAALLVAAPASWAQGGFGPDAEVTRSDETGKVVFVSTEPGSPIDRPTGDNHGLARDRGGLDLPREPRRRARFRR